MIMRKILFLTVLFLTAITGSAQDTMIAMLWDADAMTNIRNKPNGAVVMTLTSDKSYVLSLSTPQDGWWKILDYWNAEDEDEETTLAGSDTGEYWIHHSVIGLATRNYGGQELCLRDAPDEEADVIFTFNKELKLNPIDIQGDWVKVKVDGYDIVGWIEEEWLCSNPLTNCC